MLGHSVPWSREKYESGFLQSFDSNLEIVRFIRSDLLEGWWRILELAYLYARSFARICSLSFLHIMLSGLNCGGRKNCVFSEITAAIGKKRLFNEAWALQCPSIISR